MLKESLIDFSKMTVDRGPAADVLDYDGKNDLDFYKPTSDVVSILERFYIKEGIIDSDDTTLAQGDAPNRDKNAENSEWKEQDLVDIATKSGDGQSTDAGALPNGSQPNGYQDNLMDQDDTTQNKEIVDDFGVKPVSEGSLFEEFREMLLMNENASMVDTSAAETVPQGGTDVEQGDFEATAPSLGDPTETEDDYEVTPTMANTSKATMEESAEETTEENLEEALFEMEEEEDEVEVNAAPGGLEPTEDVIGGAPVMPAGDEDTVGDVEAQPTELEVPPVGDQVDQEEEVSFNDEMYEMVDEGDELEEALLEMEDDMADSQVDGEDEMATPEDDGDVEDTESAPVVGQEETLENFVEEADEFLAEDADDSNGGSDFFQEATEEDEEPAAVEDSAKTDGLFGGKDEGIPDSDKASSWSDKQIETENLDEMTELFEDTDTDDVPPGEGVTTMPNTGEYHNPDLGPDAGDGSRLEGVYEENDIFEDAMLENDDEPSLDSEPAEIKTGPAGDTTLPNEEPRPEEDQPAEIKNETVVSERQKQEESMVAKLLREFENVTSVDDVHLESVDLEDESFDD